MPASIVPEGAPRPRRRSRRTDEAIAGAVRALLIEQGYAQLTMEGVAVAAGVSKAAIYRRWQRKADMVAEVLAAQQLDTVRFPDTGDVRYDLTGFVASIARTMTLEPGALVTSLLSEMVRNPEVAEAWRGRVPALTERFEEILRRGVERGQLRRGLDAQVVGNLLIGPLYHRVLIDGEALDDQFVATVVDLVLRGIRGPASAPERGGSS